MMSRAVRAEEYAPGRATPTAPVRQWAPQVRKLLRPATATSRAVAPIIQEDAAEDFTGGGSVTLRSLRSARARHEDDGSWRPPNSGQHMLPVEHGGDTAVQRVARRVSEHAAKQAAVRKELVLPCADDVNNGVKVVVPAKLLPPREDDTRREEAISGSSALNQRHLTPPPGNNDGSSSSSPPAASPPTTLLHSSNRPRRERYYRADTRCTDPLLRQALRTVTKSPTAFQRRHLQGIPDFFAADPRHQELLERIAADVAFTTQKHRQEAILRHRADFKLRHAAAAAHHDNKDGPKPFGSSSSSKEAARRIEERPVEDWGVVATARFVNSQSRYILKSSTARERGMREQLECETCTTLDDLQYLKKQLELVDAQS